MDWQKYRLGRLQLEMRTEFKKSAMEKEKYIRSTWWMLQIIITQ